MACSRLNIDSLASPLTSSSHLFYRVAHAEVSLASLSCNRLYSSEYM
jgi:hypothetical protein